MTQLLLLMAAFILAHTANHTRTDMAMAVGMPVDADRRRAEVVVTDTSASISRAGRALRWSVSGALLQNIAVCGPERAYGQTAGPLALCSTN